MAEEYQGGVCGDTWWNPNLFYGGGGSFSSSPCSVAQFSGGYDVGNFGKSNNNNNYNQVCDDNPLVFSAAFDSNLDILGFGISPTSSTTNWDHQNQFCKVGSNEENFDSMLQDNNRNTSLNYEVGANISSTMMNSSNYSPGNSSTITNEGGLATSFPTSSTSYLLQTLFDDVVDDHQSQLISTNDFGGELMSSPCSWADSSTVNTPYVQPPLTPPSTLELIELSNKESNIQACLRNSLQSRSRAPSLNKKSLECTSYATKLKDINHEKVCHETKKNKNNEQPTAKRPRIETPSSLPTFKVRKEKLGDRITALQQLVSPFGKTDTASVLQEAIEYIKFLHDQVHVLSKPNVATAQHQSAMTGIDLRSRGLCVVPISSTYPVTQETSVDFWTPTFGGTTFR